RSAAEGGAGSRPPPPAAIAANDRHDFARDVTRAAWRSSPRQVLLRVAKLAAMAVTFQKAESRERPSRSLFRYLLALLARLRQADGDGLPAAFHPAGPPASAPPPLPPP